MSPQRRQSALATIFDTSEAMMANRQSTSLIIFLSIGEHPTLHWGAVILLVGAEGRSITSIGQRWAARRKVTPCCNRRSKALAGMESRRTANESMSAWGHWRPRQSNSRPNFVRVSQTATNFCGVPKRRDVPQTEVSFARLPSSPSDNAFEKE